jgi:hypothetical protein
MKNQKGEVVIGVLVVLMVGMMILGHGLGRGHGDRGGHHGSHMGHMDENDHGRSEKDRNQYMRDANMDKAAQPAGEEGK